MSEASPLEGFTQRAAEIRRELDVLEDERQRTSDEILRLLSKHQNAVRAIDTEEARIHEHLFHHKEQARAVAEALAAAEKKMELFAKFSTLSEEATQRRAVVISEIQELQSRKRAQDREYAGIRRRAAELNADRESWDKEVGTARHKKEAIAAKISDLAAQLHYADSQRQALLKTMADADLSNYTQATRAQLAALGMTPTKAQLSPRSPRSARSARSARAPRSPSAAPSAQLNVSGVSVSDADASLVDESMLSDAPLLSAGTDPAVLVEQLAQQVAHARAEARALTRSNTLQGQALQRLGAEKEDLAAQLQRAADEYSSDVARMTSERVEQRNTIFNLESKVAALEGERREARKAAQKAAQERARLEKQLEYAESRVQAVLDMSTEEGELQVEVENLNRQLFNCKLQRDSLEEDVVNTNAALQSVSRESFTREESLRSAIRALTAGEAIDVAAVLGERLPTRGPKGTDSGTSTKTAGNDQNVAALVEERDREKQRHVEEKRQWTDTHLQLKRDLDALRARNEFLEQEARSLRQSEATARSKRLDAQRELYATAARAAAHAPASGSSPTANGHRESSQEIRKPTSEASQSLRTDTASLFY